MEIRKSDFETLGRKVSELYPEIAKDLMVFPAFKDTSLIPQIFEKYFKKSSDKQMRIMFIGVIIQLYDPDVLTGWKPNLRPGIRKHLAFIFDVTETVISKNVRTVIDSIAIYRKFKNSIFETSIKISQEYGK